MNSITFGIPEKRVPEPYDDPGLYEDPRLVLSLLLNIVFV